MRSNLLPNTVDVSNFVGQQFVVAQAGHQVGNLSIGAHGEDTGLLSDFVFPFAEVVVKLVNELLAFLEGRDVPLPATVALVFNHVAACLRAYHIHVKTGALNLCAVLLGGALFNS